MNDRNQRDGFSLVELLVTIGILSLLIAMMIPAVQMVRSTARRATCQNNARQVALALTNYVGTHRKLPSTSGTTSRNGFFYWQTETLPYIEQNALRQAIDQKAASGIHVFHMVPERTTTIPTLQCPDNPEIGTIVKSYLGYLFAYTDYCGVAGVSMEDDSGLFPFSKLTAKGIAFSEVTDGLSNTLMFGERPPNEVGEGYGSWLGTQNVLGASIGVYETKSYISGWGDLPDDAPDEFGYGPDDRGGKFAFTHHWSFHSEGTNFARADASIHFVPYSIDRETLSALATRNGGEPVE